jgi:1-acyl-sn-glycerol-3-phosphate acyltransferase
MGRVKAFPVSRAEVRNWPLVGKGSAATGIIFVDKSSRESRAQTRTILLKEMQNGNSILIFPEGHTNVEPLTATFQKGSFEQAAAGGFPVVPFVIEYKDTRDYWDHTDSFAVHLIKRFGKRVTEVVVAFGPPLRSDNPWTLLRGSQQWIDEKIVEVRKAWDVPAHTKD